MRQHHWTISPLSICAAFNSVWWQMSNAHLLVAQPHTQWQSGKRFDFSQPKWRKWFCIRNVRHWQSQQGKMGRDNKSVSDTWLIFFGVTLIDCHSLWLTAYGTRDMACMRHAHALNELERSGKKWLRIDHLFFCSFSVRDVNRSEFVRRIEILRNGKFDMWNLGNNEYKKNIWSITVSYEK